MSTEKTIQVLDIQRLSTEDGPGLRTTVFVKGCPLRCAWCHNPESISPRRQMIWVETHCIGCGLCVKACPSGALTFTQEGQKRTEACTACGACGEACPTGANEVKGEQWQLDTLCRELVKDQVYFRESGGGVTVSGGDPMMQGEPVAKLLSMLREQGISTAVDSALLTTAERLDMVLDHADILLLDLKLAEDKEHQRWTGVPNSEILANARRVAARMRAGKSPARLWLRTPIIPGATDTPENIRALAEFVAAELSDVYERWELCAFNNLCRDKYARLGQEWQFKDTPQMRTREMDALLAAAREVLGDTTKVSWTGAVRLEEVTA